MKIKKRNRLLTLLSMLSICAFGVYIALTNLNDNIVFFYPPSELYKIKSPKEKVRIGGIVRTNSIKNDNLDSIYFTITDYESEIEIYYSGSLPALFREGQGIVAEGYLVSDKLFQAERLLVKHDEKYRPPEMKDD